MNWTRRLSYDYFLRPIHFIYRILYSIYWKFIVVDRFMNKKDPKAKNMEVLGVLSVIVGITQFAMFIVALIGNPTVTRILGIFLFLEFVIGFVFIFYKCGSIVYSLIVNIPGLKIIIIGKGIVRARFPKFYHQVFKIYRRHIFSYMKKVFKNFKS